MNCYICTDIGYDHVLDVPKCSINNKCLLDPWNQPKWCPKLNEEITEAKEELTDNANIKRSKKTVFK